MLKENEEQIFKVINNIDGNLFSMFISRNFLKVQYKIEEFVSAPTELIEVGYGLFCFSTLEDAITCFYKESNSNNNLEIYSGIGLNRLNKILLWNERSTLKEFLDSLNSEQYLKDVYLESLAFAEIEVYPNGGVWGRNHRVFEQIKLLEKISEEEIQKVIEDSGRTPKSRKESA